MSDPERERTPAEIAQKIAYEHLPPRWQTRTVVHYVATAIRDAEQRGVARERERCAKTQCGFCRGGSCIGAGRAKEPKLIGGFWVHESLDGGPPRRCMAAAIRKAPSDD